MNSNESHNITIEYEFEKSELSEFFLEDEIKCSNFVINDEKPKRSMILEDSIEFEKVVKNKGIENLKEKVFFFPKV